MEKRPVLTTPQKFKVNLAKIFNEICMDHVISLAKRRVTPPLNELEINGITDLLGETNEIDLICGFIGNTYPFWDQIKNKDLQFFVNHIDTLMGQAKVQDNHKIISDKLKNLLLETGMTEAKINGIWNYLHGMIKLSINFSIESIESNNEVSKRIPPKLTLEVLKELKVAWMPPKPPAN